ncbi:MAG TPA: TonB-dependent receptor [Gammaproteobacteria bacterium]
MEVGRSMRDAWPWLLMAPGWVGAQPLVEEIHVTGVPIRREAAEVAQSVTVLREETLDRIRGASLGETLAGQLGISSTYFGSGASRPIVRGLAGARVRTLQDGVDSLDLASLSVDHAVTIDPLIADQIEIFRGPTTLLYGSGAVGGVINTVTSRIPEAAPEEGFAGAAEVRADTAAEERSAAVRLDGGGARLAWHADGLRRVTSDYEIPGAGALHAGETPDEHARDGLGVLANSDLESEAAAAGASWLGERAFAGGAASGFRMEYGVPGHGHTEADADEHEANVRIAVEQRRLDLKAQWVGLGGFVEAVNVRSGFSDYEHVELEGGAAGARFTNDAHETRIELVHAARRRWRGALGLQLETRELAAVGEEAFVPPVDTRSYGVFVLEQLELERWQLSFGGRIEHRRHEPSNGAPKVDGTAGNVAFAAIRELGGGLTLAFNTALAERLPAAEELYAAGPHLASRTVEIGDPALGEEAARHLDVSVRKTVGDLRLSVTAFVTEYDDFIFLRDTGAVDALEALPVFAYAQADADFVGMEAELAAPIAKVGAGELDLRLYADYVKGELDDGAPLPRMPPLRYGARLRYHDERLVAGVEAVRYDEQDRTAAFETATPGYTMVDADLAWRFRASRLELFVRATNLLDEEARKHTSLVKDFVPLPGRSYGVGLRGRF